MFRTAALCVWAAIAWQPIVAYRQNYTTALCDELAAGVPRGSNI
jgi:hypothetical protein